MRMGRFVVLSVLLLTASRASASTDINGLFDARSLGLGGSGVAWLDSPAAIPTNPALLDQIGTLSISLNAFYIRSQPEAPYTVYHLDANGQRYRNYESIRSDAASAVLPFGGFAWRIFPRIVLGIAAYPVIGQGTAAKYRPAPDEIPNLVGVNDAAMGLVEAAESLSVKVLDNLSLAASWRVTYMTQEISTPVPTMGPPAGILINRDRQAVNANISVTGLNLGGFQLGVLWKPVSSLRLGFSYRSKVVVNGEGTTSTDNPLTGLPIVLDTKTAYTNPHAFRAGFAWTGLNDKLLVALDLKYLLYAEAFKTIPTTTTMNGMSRTVLQPAYWKNSFVALMGGEYKISQPLAARLGYALVQSATPEEYALAFMAPPGWSHLFTGGVGVKAGENFNVDFAAAYVVLSSTINKASMYNAGVGNYSSHGMELSLSAVYHN